MIGFTGFKRLCNILLKIIKYALNIMYLDGINTFKKVLLFITFLKSYFSDFLKLKL